MPDVRDGGANPYAPPQAEVVDDAFANTRWGSDLSGFWRRAAAAAADGVLLAFSLYVILIVFGLVLDAFDPRDVSIWPGVVAIGMLVFCLALIVGYHAVSESAAWQATPGKLAVGIKVTDLYGRRISFGRALGRFFGKCLSSVFLAGFVAAAFTARKQALHDKIAGTLVLRVR